MCVCVWDLVHFMLTKFTNVSVCVCLCVGTGTFVFCAHMNQIYLLFYHTNNNDHSYDHVYLSGYAHLHTSCQRKSELLLHNQHLFTQTTGSQIVFSVRFVQSWLTLVGVGGVKASESVIIASLFTLYFYMG